jgi:hypothetical protein
MVTSDAGTPRQHGCRVPVWLRTTAAGAKR